ncbi:MAG TPA: hypothetical protein VGE01_04735 [Fimbriimonas sp.]
MSMQKVSLAKALKIKNRQVQTISNLRTIVTGGNSRLVGAEVEFDVRETYDRLKVETDRLVAIKSAITAANVPIQPAIYRIAELKGMIAFLRGVPTKRGRQIEPYMMEDPQEFEADITAAEIEAEVSRFEREIDDLQDEIDRHNASVVVEIDVAD